MFITRMRLERIKRNWTQTYVGNEIGITKTAIHDIETGKQKPSYEVLCKLEKLFQLTHHQLFEPIAESPYSTKKA